MMYVSQIIMLYTLNLYSAVRQLYINKTGRKNNKCYNKIRLKICSCIEGTTPRVNPNAQYRLWVIMMCPCDTSIVTNIPPWCGMSLVREGVRV